MRSSDPMLQRIAMSLWLLAGLGLIALMVHTIRLDPSQALRPPTSPGSRVAVVFPDRANWLDLLEAAERCRQVGAIRSLRTSSSTLEITSRDDHSVQFLWSPARGVLETRQAVADLKRPTGPLLAVVGSSNTALTETLAQALQEQRGQLGDPGPLLLVPWATSIAASASNGSPTARSLLNLYPERTFRLCPDNRQIASTVVRCVIDHAPTGPPSRILMVMDPADPYSRDLADAFQAAFDTLMPDPPREVWVEESLSRATDRPGAAEERIARRLWAAAAAAPRGPVWLILPLQDEPTRRILSVIESLAPPDPPPSHRPTLTILCGDGISRSTLEQLADPFPANVYALSADLSLSHGPDPAIRENQTLAEIVAVIATLVDRLHEPPPRDHAQILANLQLEASDPRAIDRRIAFTPGGERSGAALGLVLHTSPGAPWLVALDHVTPAGHWRQTPLPPRPSVAAILP